ALFRAASDILTKIGIGALLALALDPLVGTIRRRLATSRTRAVLFVMGGVILLVIAVVVVMGPRAADQAESLTSDLPATVEEFYDLPMVGGWLERNDAAEKVQRTVEDLPGDISDQTVSGTIRSVVTGAVTAFIVVAVALAVMLDGEHLVARFRQVLPDPWEDRADQVGRVLYVATARYFGGSLAVAGLMGIFVLALCLVFKVPLAPLAAVWAMLTDLIPQIGGFLGGVLLGLLALTQGPVVFLVVVGLYVLYMNLENHVISPAIVGPAVDVTPPTTMLAALVGAAAAGVPGALVATPLVGAFKQLYMHLRWGHEPFEEGGPGALERFRRRLRRRRPKKTSEPEG
ncbi:MAG: AI-2E family transporter, partial [Actinomycetota bacterium]|nr:AI-2E family transporter [Actinomycetota bacterium]